MKLAYLKIKRIPRFINKQITNIFFFVFVDFFLLIQIADAHVTIEENRMSIPYVGFQFI